MDVGTSIKYITGPVMLVAVPLCAVISAACITYAIKIQEINPIKVAEAIKNNGVEQIKYEDNFNTVVALAHRDSDGILNFDDT